MNALTIVARYLHCFIKKNRNILYIYETNLLCNSNFAAGAWFQCCQDHLFRTWSDNEYFIICPRGF